MNSVTLTLPAPPSSNRWWRMVAVGGKHKAKRTQMVLSAEAKAYKADVATRAGAVTFLTEPVGVIVVWRRDRKAGDLDKRLGVLLDALQGVVYASDAQVVQIWARRCDEHPELEPGTVRVEVCAA